MPGATRQAPIEVTVDVRGQEIVAGTPAYDLNPNPDSPDRLSTAIDLDDTHASIETALAVAGYFRLRVSEAKSIVSEVEQATSSWRRDAAGLGLARVRSTGWQPPSIQISAAW